ncbi:hypothetical protein BDR26DRAFT_872524, partial [Obelidium mucronatum]
MLSLAILDLIVTAFLIKFIAGFIFARVHAHHQSKGSHCAAAAGSSCAQESTPTCPRTQGRCGRFSPPQQSQQQHPFHHLRQHPLFSHPFLQVIEVETSASPRTTSPPPSATSSSNCNNTAAPHHRNHPQHHHNPHPATTPIHTFTAEPTKFTLTVEVPGFSRDQLTTTVTDDTRQITVEGKQPNNAAAAATTRKPIALTVTVPRLGDLGKLNAVLQDGVLTIEIPKLERDGRVVEVHQGSHVNV